MCVRSLTRFPEASRILAALPQKTLTSCKPGFVLFNAGETADSVYYLQNGEVKISRCSEMGREVIIALLGPGDFVGEGCLIGQPERLASATCLTKAQFLRIDKQAVLNLLRTNSAFAEDFMSYLLSRNARYQDDLEDQLRHSTEKRLARALLLMSHLGASAEPSKRMPYVPAATLAQVVGTTRARVSQLMSSFRRAGYIDYNRREITVHASLFDVFMKDRPATSENLPTRLSA